MHKILVGRIRRRAWLRGEGTPSPNPSQSCVSALLLACTLAAACGVPDQPSEGEAGTLSAQTAPRVRPGVEVLVTDSLHLVRGKRVGLITNHTGVHQYAPGQAAGAPREAGSSMDLLVEAPDVSLVALFGPEHGIRGKAEAGARVESAVDEKTGIPIHSLYGGTLRPTPEMLEGIDVLLFDMQDIGARYYTYPSTMAFAMEAAGAQGIPFVVLDRPNPIRGDVVQGNVLDTAYSTFVGLYPTPMRNGMTVGELARLYVGEFGIDVELHVVPVDG